MTDTKHTPAPWKVSRNGHICAPHVMDEVMLVAKMSHSKNSNRVIRNKANANLISAAPDMYEYLRHFHENTSATIIGEESYNALTNIIKKAKGEL